MFPPSGIVLPAQTIMNHRQKTSILLLRVLVYRFCPRFDPRLHQRPFEILSPEIFSYEDELSFLFTIINRAKTQQWVEGLTGAQSGRLGYLDDILDGVEYERHFRMTRNSFGHLHAFLGSTLSLFFC